MAKSNMIARINKSFKFIIIVIFSLILLTCFSCGLNAPLPQVLNSSASLSTTNSLIVIVDGELDKPSYVFVEYWNDQKRLRSRIIESNENRFEITLFNLKAETSYEYQVFTVSENEQISAGPVSIFETGKLPEDEGVDDFALQDMPDLSTLKHDDPTQVDVGPFSPAGLEQLRRREYKLSDRSKEDLDPLSIKKFESITDTILVYSKSSEDVYF